MVDRKPSKRQAGPVRASQPRKKGSGGSRPGSGRKPGTVEEYKRVARARAQMTGELPHELLLKWARSGRMQYPSGRTVELDPSDRISCAKGCAAWYKPPFQARPAPGEQPPTFRLELDDKVLRSLAAKSPEKLDVLRDVLRALQAAGGDASALGAIAQAQAPRGDPARYARMLSGSSPVDGSA